MLSRADNCGFSGDEPRPRGAVQRLEDEPFAGPQRVRPIHHHDQHGVEARVRDAVADMELLPLGMYPRRRVAVAVGDEQKAFDLFVGVEPARPEPIWTSHRQTSSGGASMVIALVETGQSPMEFGSSSPGSVFLGS